MTDENKKESSIIRTGSTDLTRVGNSISLTNKLIGEIEERSVSPIIKTIKIGDQEWMIENLSINCYRNGDPIPMVREHSDWQNLKLGAYCNYKNKIDYGNKYGFLYNWFAINDSRGLAPKGFRIPSKYDWERLITCLSQLEKAEINRLSSILFESNSPMRFWYGWWEPEHRANTKEIRGNWWSKSEYELETVGAYYFWKDDNDKYRIAPYEKRGGLCVKCIKN